MSELDEKVEISVINHTKKPIKALLVVEEEYHSRNILTNDFKVFEVSSEAPIKRKYRVFLEEVGEI